MLPKNILKAPSHNPTDPTVSPAYAVLPNPTATHPLRNPDQRFIDSEVFTNKFANHLSGPMEKVTRRTLKRWSGMTSLYIRRAHSPIYLFTTQRLRRIIQSLVLP